MQAGSQMGHDAPEIPPEISAVHDSPEIPPPPLPIFQDSSATDSPNLIGASSGRQSRARPTLPQLQGNSMLHQPASDEISADVTPRQDSKASSVMPSEHSDASDSEASQIGGLASLGQVPQPSQPCQSNLARKRLSRSLDLKKPSAPRSDLGGSIPRLHSLEVWGTRRSESNQARPAVDSKSKRGQQGFQDVRWSNSLHSFSHQEHADKEMCEEPEISSHWETLRVYCRALCESWRFNLLSTALTVFALLGDDFRLFATHKQADVFFNVLTLLCMLAFACETLAASIGIQEYFLGFFFQLDVISTTTMIFDLTWVADLIYCSDDSSHMTEPGEASMERLVSNLTNARAGRTVRILRLVRLGRLYNKIYRSNLLEQVESTQLKSAPGIPLPEQMDDSRWPSVISGPILEDDLSMAGSENPEAATQRKQNRQSETRVGKKLSDLTTRRVIVLVLVMLFATPIFDPSSMGFGEEFNLSGSLATELIYTRWRSWCPTEVPGTLPWCLSNLQGIEASQRHQQRAWYEDYLLGFVYSHLNGEFAWRLFWMGLGSDSGSSSQVGSPASYVAQVARLNQPSLLGDLSIPESELWRWDDKFGDDATHGNGLKVPEEVKRRLIQPWQERCLGFSGVPLSVSMGEIANQLPTDCSISHELRCNEVQYQSPMTKTSEEEKHVNMLFAFDVRSENQAEAGLSIMRTVFICIAVGLGAWSFAKDNNDLLLHPIARIVAKMEAIKDNPFQAIKLGDIEYRREIEEEESWKLHTNRMGKCRRLLQPKPGKSREPLETLILERTLIKLGGLMALGFGEAGAEILGHNMNAGATAFVNATVPGVEVEAIFGSCGIRHFSVATEVLREKVMVFFNQVGEIVHGCVDNYHGAPNKNIGGNFLVVWRLPSHNSKLRRKIADMAVMSFITIAMEVQKSQVLATYRTHPGLQQRVHSSYCVQLGFGLHCGWAIEGAIGSRFKIDASYLSPNVNIAQALEAATKQFSIWILLSQNMVELCCNELAGLCRAIDRVFVTGSKLPMKLYTLDLDHSKLATNSKSRVAHKVGNRFKMRQIRDRLKNEKWAEDYRVFDQLIADPQFTAMRSPYSQEFILRFSVGIRNYICGAWLVARDLLLTCYHSTETSLAIDAALGGAWPEDGPVRALLHFMGQTNFQAPEAWPGYRQLADPGAPTNTVE